MNLKRHKHVLFFGIVLIKVCLCVKITWNGEWSIGFEGMEVAQLRAVDDDELHVERPRIENVTAAPVLECPYQYPDKEQFNAMLSNMMNELTKIFVKAHQLLESGEEWRKSGTRFRVIAHSENDFFKNIFNNMIREYSQFYNASTLHVVRSRDPCTSQDEIKQLWRDLLENSLTSLKKASLQCIDEYLKVQKRSDDHQSRAQLKSLLALQLSPVRGLQLQTLCDHFQLCYSELL